MQFAIYTPKGTSSFEDNMLVEASTMDELTNQVKKQLDVEEVVFIHPYFLILIKTDEQMKMLGNSNQTVTQLVCVDAKTVEGKGIKDIGELGKSLLLRIHTLLHHI